MRLPPQPGEVVDRTTDVAFTWNGKGFQGLAGDTIVSALMAAGVRVFSRSLKYHRPRGAFTVSTHDPNTLVQVGDEPNVRAGHRLLLHGMQVSAQNAWPSLAVDVKALNRLVGRFLSPGFYYKTFMAPAPMWPLYQRLLRRFINAGRVPNVAETSRFDHQHAHPDVVVAGGGPAGMAAAVAAARSGASVLLVEQEHHLGGHLRYGTADELMQLAELRDAVESAGPGIEVATDAVVAGRYDHNLIAVDTGHTLIKARAKVLVVAAGTIERPFVFAGNDLPGVMLSTAVRRLINLYAVKPGDRAVVLSANQSGEAAVADLESASVDVVEVVELRSAADGARLLAAHGGRRGVRNVQLDDGRKVKADLLVTATGWTGPTSLLNMAGCRPVYRADAARFVPGPLPNDVMATGGIVGDGSTAELVDHGDAVGGEAAARAAVTLRQWRGMAPSARPLNAPVAGDVAADPAAGPQPVPELPPAPHPELFRSTHGFVDFSEDVSSNDIASAVAEGYDSMELNKRYTTATMGAIQGKLESVNALAVLAEATGQSIADTATTTWRPPYAPVSLGVLAGRNLEPVRVSPMQEWHDAHGASRLLAGQWVRPDHYGDRAAEVRNVRSGVGIIDVSPLGKIDLRGADVPKLLNFVYVNRWSKLAVGAVRYGVMCADDGVVLDDGVVGRLGKDRYLMSTTSSGAATVWNWLDEWLQTSFPEWDVTMTAVTDGYASINVAGPRSRDLMAPLTGVDLSPEAFGYMRVRTGTVAGVDGCVLWRIGFTGELSYEIHIPAGHGLHVWETLLESGREHGVRPFGIEAQRIMRLEKGHFIVGQDTDGLTHAYSAGLDWAIKLDKQDFAGRPELAWQQESGGYPMLVALQPVDPAKLPAEGCQIVSRRGRRGEDVIVGRVTSSRMSPTLERAVCFGIVEASLAAAGTRVVVLTEDGERIDAEVMAHHAHFDPAGERLRA